MVRLNSLFTIHCSNRAVSHAFFSLCKHWNYPEFYARMTVPSCDPSCRVPNLVEAIPPFLRRFYYGKTDTSKQAVEKRFLKDLRKFDAAYLWPGVSIDTLKRVKDAGKPIFLERINCYMGTAKYILDDAYKNLDVPPQHRITLEDIQDEQIEANIADFILSPSPEVTKSFKSAGIDEEKIIEATYGWCPERHVTALKPPSGRSTTDEVSVLFLGSVCVRKGAHILLRAWAKSGIKGKLVLFGRLEQTILETCGEILKRPDIVHYEYSKNYSYAYQEADIFAFPSLEEGSPLVIYEAMAHGLPILTSSMGAGHVVRNGIDGWIVSPYEEDALVESLQKLAASPDLRFQFGNAAYHRARDFTWEKTAQRRAAAMLEKLRA